MKYIASVSFGKDSLAMLLKILYEKKPFDDLEDKFKKESDV